MILDSGIITVCELKNTASKGDMPKETLVPICQQYYGARTVSYARQYQAKGVNEQVDILARIWDEGYQIRIGMYAIIEDNQYRITNIAQALDDDTNLRIYDLSLERLDDLYALNF